MAKCARLGNRERKVFIYDSLVANQLNGKPANDENSPKCKSNPAEKWYAAPAIAHPARSPNIVSFSGEGSALASTVSIGISQ
jgi:hypothetical protein